MSIYIWGEIFVEYTNSTFASCFRSKICVHGTDQSGVDRKLNYIAENLLNGIRYLMPTPPTPQKKKRKKKKISRCICNATTYSNHGKELQRLKRKRENETASQRENLACQFFIIILRVHRKSNVLLFKLHTMLVSK